MRRPEPQPVSSQDLEAVRQILCRRFGFWVKDDWLGRLREKIRTRMEATGRGASSEYRQCLELPDATGPAAAPEARELIEELLIHESQFRRNPEQLATFAQEILPDWQAGPAGQTRRVASLGCSTGEEAYTLAMCIEDSLGQERAEAVQIVGLDLSRRAIETARRGHYPTFRLRDLPTAFRTRHFTESPDGWQIDARLRRRVRFLQHNLLEPLPVNCLDAIFCCNVLIYFPPASARNALEHAYRALKPHGHLFLGPTDSALGLRDRFEPLSSPDTTYYRRLPSRLEPGAPAVTPQLPSHHEPLPQQP